MMVHFVYKNDLIGCNTKKAAFFKECFPEAWKFAAENPGLRTEMMTEWERLHLRPQT